MHTQYDSITNGKEGRQIEVAAQARRFGPESGKSIGSIAPETQARFWSQVDKRGAGECWPWMGSKMTAGYGRLWIARVGFAAHRVAFTLSVGIIPDGMCVCHRCDNPICCNPSHLWMGTQFQNTMDKEQKGRGNQIRGAKHAAVIRNLPTGELHWKAKLTSENINQIRDLFSQGKTKAELARQFCVAHRTVRCILNRTSWRHI